MCKASVVANHVTQARDGETYGVGQNEYGVGGLHPIGSSLAQCVACVQTDQLLTLSGIPQQLQETLGISDLEEASFVEMGDDVDDVLVFGNNAIAHLGDFADQNVLVYVGVIDVGAMIAGSQASSRELQDA